MRVPTSCAALGALLLFVPVRGSGAEYSVRPDGTGDFLTIQAAVDAALPGDEIVLEDGTFVGAGNRDIDFLGKDVVVRSRNGALACTIDSQGSPGDPHRAFHLHSGETAAARIEGITITGGYVEGPFPQNGGGGILVEYGTHPTIRFCTFTANTTGFQGFGAGLLTWEDCDITLTDCVFVGNDSGWYGGGFTLRRFCDATVERCIVDGNYALHAGGGASITRSNAIVTDCQFTNNWVTEAGGGGVLVKAEAEPVFTRCVFAGNSSWGGSGLGLGNAPIVTVIDCLFEGNTAVSSGAGGLGLDPNGSQVSVFNSTFVNNRGPNTGVHVIVNGTSSATIRNSIFYGICQGTTSIEATSFNSTVNVDCSIIQGGAAGVTGLGVIYGPDNVDADPLFCGPATCAQQPLPAGLYTVDTLSPAAPTWNACGLVGAYGAACGPTSAAEMELRSWGAVKAAYR